MAYANSRSVKFQEDVEFATSTTFETNSPTKDIQKVERAWRCGSSSRICPEKPCKSFKQKVLSRVFSEDYESLISNDIQLFDPRSPAIHRWNKIFLVASLVSLFLDPLFFYIPETRSMECIDIGIQLEVALTIARSLADAFYAIQIFVRLRTAFVAPSSRVLGRGELVIDPTKIASRYLSKSFCLDLIAALPLPQFLIWVVIPNLKDSTITNTKNFLRFSIIIQYLPRLFLILPLSKRIVRMTGVMTENAWAGAAYNLILYMLASHVIGASWYLLSIERQEACWREACRVEGFSCQYQYFECKTVAESWNPEYPRSNLTKFCNPNNNLYHFGIYGDAVDFEVTSSPFFQKYFYCFWWGLKNLSCLGQNLSTTTNVAEISFAIVIAVVGLVLFGLLIGNMQSYLQSTTARLEEWRVKRTDAEQWMHHRQLPSELKQCVRRYHQFKWVATRGVDEEALLKGLPVDLRRDIKRHLCLDLVRRVPLFDEMDERMLEAICERLRPALYTHGTCLARELDPVNEMLFIIRGYLDSNTTNGGRTGFFNSCRIGPGEFCGDELLTWALDPRPTVALPLSTRTVQAVSEVEAFALVAEDLKFVASQFRRLHSKQLRHKFRFYSQQWRTWAACFIQAAWRRQKRRRASMELRVTEGDREAVMGAVCLKSSEVPSPGAGAAAFAALLTATAKKGKGEADPKRRHRAAVNPALKKPKEPDFSTEEEES
ncbi:protein CNGC15b [Canna indica]|uniref:Protein CNGC15b n=1 Tax=Canna indica TaxID=4628 RepID=A0AAQ3QS31_9LILI|nr:protein CNGC15b [Canna indica]